MLRITTVVNRPESRSACPTSAAARFTLSRLRLPSSALGVPTHSSTRSAPGMASSMRVVAESRPAARASAIICPSPASTIGLCPRAIMSTFHALVSTPTIS